MEFTRLLKQGSAVLFLVLLVHGLVLGFSSSSTILSVVLAFVVCLFEAQLVKSERIETEERITSITRGFQDQINNMSKTHREDKVEMLERIAATHSQISAIKMNQGIRKL